MTVEKAVKLLNQFKNWKEVKQFLLNQGIDLSYRDITKLCPIGQVIEKLTTKRVTTGVKECYTDWPDESSKYGFNQPVSDFIKRYDNRSLNDIEVNQHYS